VDLGLALSAAANGPEADPGWIRDLTRAAEALGLHSAWVPDHVVIPVGSASPYPSGSGPVDPSMFGVSFDPLATLPYLAGLTRRLRLGISVLVVPYRNPLVVAKWLASLDQLSGGRIMVGIGVGWLAEEFAALGEPRFAERGPLTDECVAIWKAVWTGRPPGFEGRFYRFGPLLSGPRPLQVPHPPIHVGGNGRAALRRVIALGADGWHLTGLAPDGVADRVGGLRAALAEAGRRPEDVLVSLRVTVDLRDGATGTGAPGLVAGDSGAVIEACRRYRHAGVGLLVPGLPRNVSPAAQLRMLERLAREVMPALA
jgi:probable F420-dependent oxidoreductase